jgi:hypothetical protein
MATILKLAIKNIYPNYQRFNQLYYDCKHLIVLIIVECTISDRDLGFNNCSLLIVINGQ